MADLGLVLLAFALVLFNAFFVAAEFGMVKLRHTRVTAIKKRHGLRGSILAHVHKHLDAYLSACQLGITLASLGLGWVGEPAFAHLLVPVFSVFGFTSQQTVWATSLTVAFLIITFLHIVVGELMPKSIAIRQSEQVSLWTALPLYAFYWLMFPIIWFMNNCANALLKLIWFGRTRSGDHFYSTEEIKLILSSSFLHGELSRDEKRILEHTLDLGELKVTDVMRPADEMVAFDIHQSMKDALDAAANYRYSRYPVYENARDNIVGIVHVKDLFAALYQQRDLVDLTEVVRPVLKVTRRLPALELLRKFRGGMPHFALVYRNREEDLIGFVTLDNLLHVLIGRIKDEFHRTRDDWEKEENGNYLIPGNASIYTLERALDIDIESEGIDEEIDTLNGLILSKLISPPRTGTRIVFNQFDIQIAKMKGDKIAMARVIPKRVKAHQD